MASVQPDHEEVNKLLRCAVCIEQFKEPKVLSCLHTYCKECLVKLVKKKGRDHIITCPECRQDTKIIDGDVGKLQPNFWVNNFMTLMRMQGNTSSGKPLICEHCDSSDSAVSRCTNCCVFMCEFCITAHKRINATKDHQILSLEEVRKLGGQALAKPAFCEKHVGEALKLFCQTCQKTICRDCTIVDHREHKYDFVADVAEKERKTVQATLNKTRAKECTVAAGLKATQMMKICIAFKVSEVNKQVDSFFDEQVKALEHHRAKLKHEAATQGQVKVNQIESKTKMLSLLLAQLKSGIGFTERAIADGDDVKLLSMKKQLIQRLSQLNSSQNQLTPCKDDFLKLQVHQAIPDIGKFVTVCYSPCDPPKCTVSMVGGEEGVMYQTIAGQSVDFMLVIKDDKGCKVTKGGYEVRVQVIQNYQQILTPAVQDHGDGLYSFSCAGVAGIATLTVEVEGQNVRGCPFNWEVNPENRIPERTGQSRKGNFYDPVKQNAFREGRHSWKLQLVSFNPDQKSSFNGLEIGVESHVYDERGRKQLGVKWCWYYHPSQSQNFKRSDGQQPSITSVQDHDVFTVFLNLETKKLVIYNVRSKQVELFTGVDGDHVLPMISPRCTSSLTLDVQ